MKFDKESSILECGMKRIKNAFAALEDPKPRFKKQEKDNDSAMKWKIEGDKQINHEKNSHLHAWISYTRALLYAPSGSKTLVEAYEHRSMLLFHLRRYEETIADIDRAMKIADTDNRRVKLLLLKLGSLAILRKPIAKNTLKRIKYILKLPDLEPDQKNSLEEMLKYAKSCINQPDAVSGKTPASGIKTPIIDKLTDAPCASDSIAIHYSEESGRHIRATKNIEVGEILCTEKSYASFVCQDGIFMNCSNCQKVEFSNIPCDHCVYAMYCTEECKGDAWKNYHEVECSIVGSLWNLEEENTRDPLCLRILIKAIKDAGGIEKLKHEVEEVESYEDERTRGFSDGSFLHTSYKSLYSLMRKVTHNLNRSKIEELEKLTVLCLYFLATHTTIFGEKFQPDLRTLAENQNILFAGALLLQHFFAIPILGYTKHNLTACDTEKFKVGLTGGGIQVFCNLFNHSCDANTGHFLMNCTKVIYARYPIKANEEIFDNYGYTSINVEKTNRQAEILSKFNFICQCKPCLENWPVAQDLQSIQTLLEDSPRILNSIKKSIKLINQSTEMYKHKGTTYCKSSLVKVIEQVFENAPRPNVEICQLVTNLHYFLTKEYGTAFQFPDCKFKSCKRANDMHLDKSGML